MKKLIWTEAARWRAKEQGQVRRKRSKAGRRLTSAHKNSHYEVDQDLDMMDLMGEKQEVSTLTDKLAELTGTGGRHEVEQKIRQVGASFGKLSIMKQMNGKWKPMTGLRKCQSRRVA